MKGKAYGIAFILGMAVLIFGVAVNENHETLYPEKTAENFANEDSKENKKHLCDTEEASDIQDIDKVENIMNTRFLEWGVDDEKNI